MSQSPIPITQGSGASSVAAELVSGTSYQQIQVYGGGGASVLSINPDGSLSASVIGTPTVKITGNPSISGTVTVVGMQGASVSGTVGASIIGQLPGGTAVIGSVATLQGTVPWIISSVYGNISGSVVGFQGGARTISGSVFTILAPVASLVSGLTSVLTTTTQVSVIGTPAGAQRYYLTNLTATNAAAVGTFVNFYDGPNIVFSGFAAASGGGFSAAFPVPIRLGSLNTALGVAITIQASVVANASGYTAA